MSMDGGSAGSVGMLFQCLIALAVKRGLIFANICLQFHLQQLFIHRPLPDIWFSFSYLSDPTPFPWCTYECANDRIA